MTTTELFGILRRRWYVALLGLALLVGALAYVASRPGVYWAQADVVILAPKSARYPNVIEQTSQSLISMAGLIERDVNKGIVPPATSTSSVTLAGEGVRDGHAIKLPNDGGQWANNFDRPVLDIQVVGPDPVAVKQKLSSLVDVVTQELKDRQDEQAVPLGARITASSAPAVPAVFYLSGSHTKALGVTLILGGGLIAMSTVGADRFLNSRSRRRRERAEITRVGILA